MLEGLLLALDVLGMLILMRWSMAQEKLRDLAKNGSSQAHRSRNR